MIHSPRLPVEESRAGVQPSPTLAHRVVYGAYWALTAVLTSLPERISDVFSLVLGHTAYSVFPVRKKDVLDHLLLAFPDSTHAWRVATARRAFVHFVRETIETLWLTRRGLDLVRSRTEVVGLDDVRRAVEEGKGAIVLTGHLGNWEIGVASVSARGLPTDVVAHRQTNPLFDEYWIRIREGLDLRTLVKNDAFQLIPRSLDEGRMVALVADQNLRARGVFVKFFGKLASTAKGPALFALRRGASIFLGVALRQPGWPPRYRLQMDEIEVPMDGSREERVLELTQRHTKALEAWVRKAPEQYFWMHRRWKTQPTDDPVRVAREAVREARRAEPKGRNSDSGGPV
jgi:Kdo2-lipid IVA lauroyltransferase/acyltransferase